MHNQYYTEIPIRHFPGRPNTMAFLHKLHQWVIGHYETVSNIDFTKILVIFTILPEYFYFAMKKLFKHS